MMGPAAHRIEAEWDVADGAPPRVRILTPEPTPVARLLRGRAPEAALGLIPLVFNLCAGAQEAAARAALGRDVPMGRRVAAETLREHALRCLKDWPEALGLQPDLSALVGVGRLEHADGSARLGALERALFGDDRSLSDPVGFAQSSRATPARVLRIVLDWPEEWARDPNGVVPELDPTLLRRVAADRRFAPLLSERGPSLFARLFARLVDAARMIEILRAERPPAEPERLGPGVGAAEAARGRLVHRAWIEAGRIVDYAVETPTDAVMAEDGMLARMVASAGLAPRELRPRIAQLAILACDPCAPVSLVAQPEKGCANA